MKVRCNKAYICKMTECFHYKAHEKIAEEGGCLLGPCTYFKCKACHCKDIPVFKKDIPK